MTTPQVACSALAELFIASGMEVAELAVRSGRSERLLREIRDGLRESVSERIADDILTNGLGRPDLLCVLAA